MNPATVVFSQYAHAAEAVQGTQTTLAAVVIAIRGGTWGARVAAVRAAYQSGASKDEVDAIKKTLPGVTFSARFHGQRGKDAPATRSGLICADLDKLGEDLAHVRAAIQADPRTLALFVSPGGNGLKAVFRCDLSRPHYPDTFHAARAHVLALTGREIDPKCKDVSRLCFVSHDPEAYLAPDPEAVPLLDPAPLGSMSGFDDDGAEAATVDTEGDDGDPESVARARAYLAAMPPAVSGDGGHDATFKAALALTWGFGFNDATALPLLEEFNARCSPPWTVAELEHKLATSRDPSPDKPPFRYLRPLAGAPVEAAGFATDLDASARFAKAHADKLRYSPGLGWLFWDGKRWAQDAEGRAVELSKQAARDWVRSESATADGDARARRIKSALALESAGHVKGAVELAKTDPRLVLTADRLDRDAYLLNVQNGTLDLRTGQLRPHRREDLITKLAPVDYVAGATHPTLAKYLDHLEGHLPGMAAFLARCFGAALTGDASPESLFLLQGEGGSGKTTLTEAVAEMLGDYAAKLPFESFVLSRRGTSPGGARSDLMTLRGARLAYASEGDKSARLDAGMVKALTGGESVTAREVFSRQITFAQTWKLWLVSNYEPRADSDDTGIWRRMLKIPFPVIPAEQRDPTVKRTLTRDDAARSALLAWALAGCLDWQARGGGRIGLAAPASVEAETEAYRKKQDVLGAWWEDLLASEATLNAAGRATAKELRHHYDEWAQDNGERAVTLVRFAEFLRSKGLEEVKGAKGVRCWRGVQMDAESFWTKTPSIAPAPANLPTNSAAA